MLDVVKNALLKKPSWYFEISLEWHLLQRGGGGGEKCFCGITYKNTSHFLFKKLQWLPNTDDIGSVSLVSVDGSNCEYARCHFKMFKWRNVSEDREHSSMPHFSTRPAHLNISITHGTKPPSVMKTSITKPFQTFTNITYLSVCCSIDLKPSTALQIFCPAVYLCPWAETSTRGMRHMLISHKNPP